MIRSFYKPGDKPWNWGLYPIGRLCGEYNEKAYKASHESGASDRQLYLAYEGGKN